MLNEQNEESILSSNIVLKKLTVDLEREIATRSQLEHVICIRFMSTVKCRMSASL
jgi:hypothetical protein